MRFRNPETKVGKVLFAGTALLGSAALLSSGCGSSNEGHSQSRAAIAPARPVETLTFDALGGGSSVIEVFPTPESDQYDGTYYDGDTANAICKTEGRERRSDPSVGEEKRQSDEWIRIEGAPGEPEYATAVYIKHPGQLLEELPDC